MAFKVAKGSLFAVLSRSSWWYSAAVGLFFIGVSLVLADGQYVILGIASSLPFFGIAGFAAHKQSKLPSNKRVLEVAKQAQKMRASEIAEKISNCYVKHGYEAYPSPSNAADWELARGHRKLLLSTKRFKVGNTGVEPLKQLIAAGESVEATAHLYVALGEISAAAQDYAYENNIELIQASRLTALFDDKVQIE